MTPSSLTWRNITVASKLRSQVEEQGQLQRNIKSVLACLKISFEICDTKTVNLYWTVEKVGHCPHFVFSKCQMIKRWHLLKLTKYLT
ncbi:hypothetical protein ACHWQZ_G009459 [Mnemiopsis leidyi]